MAKKDSLAGNRETLRATLRTYKLWHQYSPQMLPSLVAHGAVSGVAPYVTIYFSAQLLNELAGGRDPPAAGGSGGADGAAHRCPWGPLPRSSAAGKTPA